MKKLRLVGSGCIAFHKEYSGNDFGLIASCLREKCFVVLHFYTPWNISLTFDHSSLRFSLKRIDLVLISVKMLKNSIVCMQRNMSSAQCFP